MRLPSSDAVTVRGMGRALAGVVAVIVVGAMVWLAVAVGGRFAPAASNDSSASSSPIAQAAAPSADPTTDVADATPTATLEPTTEPTTEPTLEPSVEPTPEATPKPTAKPTAKPTHRPTPDPGVEPAPIIYNVTGAYGATVKLKDMTARAVKVPVPDWATSINCNTSGTDESAALEITLTWPGHTHLGDLGISIGGDTGMGGIATEDSFSFTSGVPKVVAYCHLSTANNTALLQYDRSTQSQPIIYNWHIH